MLYQFYMINYQFYMTVLILTNYSRIS